ncbi:gypsy/ty3 retroelement polyprotein [Tanacetum coccineum]
MVIITRGTNTQEPDNQFAKINAGEGTSSQGGNGGNHRPPIHINNTQQHHSPYGKLTRLDFPKFNGKDVKGWLSIGIFFKTFGENVPWNVYETEILSRFGEVYDDPLVELKNLKQTGDVQSYQDKFKMLLNKVDLFESQAVSMFMRGLKSKVGVHLRMFKPITMKDVSCLAKMQEATAALTKSRPQYSYNSSRYMQSNVTPKVTVYPPKPPLLALPPAHRPSSANLVRRQLT